MKYYIYKLFSPQQENRRGNRILSENIRIAKLLKNKFNKCYTLRKDRTLLTSLGISTVYAENTQPAENVVQTVVPTETIPEPPPLPVQETVETITQIGDASLESLGLGGWGPVGLIQNCLEYFHLSLALPWWGAIALGKIIYEVNISI